MKLTIDNNDGQGPRDYSASIDGSRPPDLVRKLNRVTELRLVLVANADDFVVPVEGARVLMGRMNGKDVFAGTIVGTVEHEYLGYGERGPLYRYKVVALSDEALLDKRTIPPRPPFVARSAGEALRVLTDDLLPGVMQTSEMENGDTMPWYSCRAGQRWSEAAADMALLSRGCYRMGDAELHFSPLEQVTYELNENAIDFYPAGLDLRSGDCSINDLTVIGRMEPGAYVRDYFVGDGFSLRFYLSQVPFTRSSRVLVDEEFATLDPTRWTKVDPDGALSVNSGKLTLNGGSGADGGTRIEFRELVELGGALVLQHGDVLFQGSSDGVLGGLYGDAIAIESCVAGFRITPMGAESRIQALVDGAATGAGIVTQPGHRYVLTTRVYASEVYRAQQAFHSSKHPSGEARGGPDIAADARVILEVHEIDPTNPGTMVAPSTVLYEGLRASVRGFCRYALVNASDMYCSIAFTRLTQAVDAEVRTALPGQPYRTRLAGSLAEGGECRLSEEPSLSFYPQDMPAANELIVVSYRGRGRARARVMDPVSVVAHRHGTDDGVRGAVRQIVLPAPRTSADCEYAALAVLDDASGTGWSGEYRTWNSSLPGGAEDIFPGDGLHVIVPSQGADFDAIVREVQISCCDLANENWKYTIRFADETKEPLSFSFDAGAITTYSETVASEIGNLGQTFLPSLTTAAITQPTSTSVAMDAGIAPLAGGGIEVRRTDAGWGMDNDRNLIGRFTTQAFTVPRLARIQDFFLRQYDGTGKYSRYSAVLHLDYPL